MVKRIISLVFLLLAYVLAGVAAEFWLEPKKFHYGVGEEMKIDFREGDAFTGGLWDLQKNGVEVLQWYSATGMKDVTKTVKSTKGNNVIMKFAGEGTQLFAFKGRSARRAWGGEQFNEWLTEREFTEISEIRRGTTNSDDSVKEEYVQFAKVLVQVGERVDDTFKKKTGQRLEIIPAKNPYLLKTGDYLSCQVLFEGKPLPHALVKVWNRLNNTTFLQNIYSEKDGTIVFPISVTGVWMVSTAKMISSEKPAAEWDSVWATLVFGI